MPESIAVISDATCLIALTNIGELEILHQLYQKIITTHEVQNEYGFPLPEWLTDLSPQDKQFQKILELFLMLVKRAQ